MSKKYPQFTERSLRQVPQCGSGVTGNFTVTQVLVQTLVILFFGY